jgi:hypothetical protein
MTITLARPARLDLSGSDAPALSSRRQRRRADKAARRYQEEKRRHDRAILDDRYLDRTGIELSPTDFAAMWQH